ncbi:MAG: tyrosine-type recombinase/integrase [Solidesulfovibrio sp.]|uniref:tyrosine-type recombinase/integrase n=1 Tax=Solidesulfovibrio sp. TaxID=2910990 RepID=UPI002B1FF41B|nr:tyrosine-type recombinase/integrase [Solidesulfovibrio sp.]MEA4857079.1 tyrosine-type recombinase/integrase [Solidesulfovibrio sp.]
MPKKLPTNYPGVRYREHDSRKCHRRPDRYFFIRYRRLGHNVEEGLGWASQGWTAEDASRILGQIQQNIKRGTGPQSLKDLAREARGDALAAATKPIVFGELATRYLEWAKRNKTSWKEDEYLLRKRILPLFADRPAATITRTDVEAFRDSLADTGRLSPMTIKHHLVVLRRVYNWASATPVTDEPDRMLFEGRNPVVGIRMPLIDNERIRFLTREEADRLLEAATERLPELHDIILLALLTGMRRQEVLGLTWQDVDMVNRLITIPAGLTRTKRSRKVFLDDEMSAMLQLRREHAQTPFVFPGLSHGHRGEDQVTRQFDALVNAIGLNDGVTDAKHKVVFHTLRHTFASWLAQAGADMHHLMELTGHKSLSMLQRYAHLMPERTRAVASLVSRRASRSPKGVPPESSEA